MRAKVILSMLIEGTGLPHRAFAAMLRSRGYNKMTLRRLRMIAHGEVPGTLGEQNGIIELLHELGCDALKRWEVFPR